jgi:hypothetical protein
VKSLLIDNKQEILKKKSLLNGGQSQTSSTPLICTLNTPIPSINFHEGHDHFHQNNFREGEVKRAFQGWYLISMHLPIYL